MSLNPNDVIDDWITIRDSQLKPQIVQLCQQKGKGKSMERDWTHRDLEGRIIIPFMALECALSRVIEGLILLDRYLYLVSQGMSRDLNVITERPREHRGHHRACLSETNISS